MSLEEVIAENTAAVRELIGALRSSAGVRSTDGATRATKAARPLNGETPLPAPAMHALSHDADPREEDLTTAAPTLGNLRRAMQRISQQRGREQVEAILARFGAKALIQKPGATGLNAAHYEAAFALCLAVLAGRVNACAVKSDV